MNKTEDELKNKLVELKVAGSRFAGGKPSENTLLSEKEPNRYTKNLVIAPK